MEVFIQDTSTGKYCKTIVEKKGLFELALKHTADESNEYDPASDWMIKVVVVFVAVVVVVVVVVPQFPKYFRVTTYLVIHILSYISCYTNVRIHPRTISCSLEA